MTNTINRATRRNTTSNRPRSIILPDGTRAYRSHCYDWKDSYGYCVTAAEQRHVYLLTITADGIATLRGEDGQIVGGQFHTINTLPVNMMPLGTAVTDSGQMPTDDEMPLTLAWMCAQEEERIPA